jgi:armadillo repeat-containing protein 8
MPATPSGGARPEEATPATPASTSAAYGIGTRPEDLTARLVGGGAVERERVLRQIKNDIIGNPTKKLLYLRLGAVPAVVAALADPHASTAALVEAAAAAGSFACRVDGGARAVLDTGAAGHLTRLLKHPDKEVGSSSVHSIVACVRGNLTGIMGGKVFFMSISCSLGKRSVASTRVDGNQQQQLLLPSLILGVDLGACY